MIATIVAIYLVLLLALNTEGVQRQLAHTAEGQLSELLHTRVTINRLRIGLFNYATLHDVRIEDQQHQRLLEAGLVSAKIELLPLLHGEVSLRSVSLLDADARLYKSAPDAPTNFQFIIDALSSKDKSKPSHLDLRINSIILRRCNVAYDEWYKPHDARRFDLSHLRTKDIDANISLKRITNDSLNLRIRNLSLREHSGLDVRTLSLRMAANKRQCRIEKLCLALRGSRIKQERLIATYDFDHLLTTLTLRGQLRQACCSTQDLRPLLPALGKVNEKIHLSTTYDISPSHLTLHRLRLTNDDQSLRLLADVTAHRNSTDGEIRKAEAHITELHADNATTCHIISQLTGQPLPSLVSRLGDLTLRGTAQWDKYKAKGGLINADLLTQSALGQISLTAIYGNKRLKGSLHSDCITTAPLGLADIPDNISLTLCGTADLTSTQHPTADITTDIRHLTWRGNTLTGIQANAHLAGDIATLQTNSTANQAAFTMASKVRLHQGKGLPSDIYATLDLHRLDLKGLGLIGRWGNANVAGHVVADIKGLNTRGVDGEIKVSDFRLTSLDDATTTAIDGLQLTAHPSANGTHLHLNSDFAVADFEGVLDIAAIKDCIQTLIAQQTHAVDKRKHRVTTQPTTWRFALNAQSNDALRRLTGLHIYTDAPLTAFGTLQSDAQALSLTLTAPHLKVDGTELRNVKLYTHGQGDSLRCQAGFTKHIGKSDVDFELHATSGSALLKSQILWEDNLTHHYTGALSAETRFDTNARGYKIAPFHTVINPTTIAVGDTIWQMQRGELTWTGQALDVHRVALTHDDCSLHIHGRASDDTADSLQVDLRKIDVDYVLGLINFNAVAFGGLATGHATVQIDDGYPEINARLHIPDFKFNYGPMGTADIAGRWEGPAKTLHLDADMRYPDAPNKGTHVKGFVSPANDRIDLAIKSEGTNLRLLRRYIGGIFGDFEGEAYGHCRIFSSLKKLDFEGHERVTAKATVLSTGVRYDITDGIIDITPGRFDFTQATISDGRGGEGNVTGFLSHQHLKHFCYDVKMQGSNIRVYDKPRTLDDTFYATAVGTGSIHLVGAPGTLNADINMSPNTGTDFTYIYDSPDTYGDTSLLTLRKAVEAEDTTALRLMLPEYMGRLVQTTIADKKAAEEESKSDIRLNFTVDVNPSATLRIIMDDRTGDNIALRSYGPMHASWYNKGPFHMYGTLNIEDGIYSMSIQELIRKNFEFQRGSRITFSGEPFDGDLDLKATYTVNSASLSDLNIGTLSDNSIRVNCLLNIQGKVQNPIVTFDLDLPTISEEEKQMVRSLIASEEDMNMQVLYLLGVGRFYTYNYNETASATTQSQTNVAMKSFLSTTLSSQFNNLLSNAIGNRNWTFGANLATGTVGWSDMEIEGLLSGKLFNNRLLINGNFGYRDRPTMAQTNFVGDFDVQYLLTPTGTVRLKAYSETNDRYFTKSSPTTQGIGIKLQRDFTSLRDLFKRNKTKKHKQ